MATLTNVQIPLLFSEGLIPAMDQYEGVILVVRKNEPVTASMIRAFAGDASTFRILVKKTPDLEERLRANRQSIGERETPECSPPPARSSLEKSYPSGSVLFREDDLSKEIYILMSGSVEIVKNDTRIAEISKPGTFLGEISALLDEPRTATIRTIQHSTFTVVSGEGLLETAKQHPALLLKLCKSLARKVSATTTELIQYKL